ncbi:hypothetical protein C8Q80DRAFT_1272310 [Daedaleopsis nitida]|nr:hypothetical protein C8Q80DRAFT_1272310 [Daedaleopsis nitida]
MSMQIHAPTPVLSTRPMSPPSPTSTRPRSRSRTGSTSRPSSPLTSTVPLPSRPPMTRPPSRSERLLRDTLRRAEEQERMMNPTPSLFGMSPPVPTANVPPSVAQMFGPCRLPAATQGGRRHRRNTSSSAQSDSSCDYFDGEVLDEDSQEDEDDNEWLWRGNSAGHPPTHRSHAYPPIRAVSRSRVEGVPHVITIGASKTFPFPVCLQHPPHLPSRASVDGEHALTPHEAVLRSQLVGVLKGAKPQDRRTRSVERRDPDSGLSSGSSNSMASSRNLSGEGDFFFGANGDSSLTSLTSNDARPKYSPSSQASPRSNPRALQMAPHGSPRSTHKPLSSKKGSVSSVGPLTPPPSPPFNARQAAAQCKAMDGYISFATIEGLGVPEGSDEEADEEAKSRSRWFQWLHISGKTAPNDRARGRGESSSSASR